MPEFSYKGRNRQGELVEGTMEGASEDAVASQLVNNAVTPIAIELHEDKPSAVEQINRVLAGGVGIQSLILFCRQMYSLTKSGVPLTKGMRGIADSMRHAGFSEALEEIAESLESGMDLSTALARHPKIFNRLFISIIHVGENSGRLDRAFDQLSQYLERDDDTRRRIKTATRYPSFVMMAMVAAVVVINLKVIPAFAGMFAKYQGELPWATQVLLTTSEIFVNYWYWIFLSAIGLVAGWIMYLRTESGDLWWSRNKLRIPIIGSIINRSIMARYTRSFSMMMSAGVPLIQALDLCSYAVDNAYLQQKVGQIREGVQRGETLYRTHALSQMFTPLVLQMISVGEESGKVDDLLLEVAEFYERDVDYDLRNLTDKIEPILIAALTGMVLILALAIFVPIWDMAGSAGH